jgi:hypothetical protein
MEFISIDEIANIARENFSGYKGNDTLQDRRKVIEEIIFDSRNENKQPIFLATLNQKDAFCATSLISEIVGYICWEQWGGPNRVDGDTWELKRIAVKKSMQGKHIRHVLILDSLERIKERILARGSWLKNIIIFTGAENKAQRLYADTLGAKVDATIKDLFRGDEVMMIARFQKPE